MNNNEKNRLTLDEVIKIISSHSQSALGNNWSTAASCRTQLTFDAISIESEYLVFSQFNCFDMVSFPVREITDIFILNSESPTSQVYLEFNLANGEQWFVISKTMPRLKLDERCVSIEVDEVVEMLRRCECVDLSYERLGILLKTTHYDTVEIIDACSNYDLDRAVTVVLEDSCSNSSCVLKEMSKYTTKFYITMSNKHMTKLHLCLYGTPFTDILMTIYHSNEEIV